MWHQSCQGCKYTTWVDSKKMRYKKLFTHAESHASVLSVLESGGGGGGGGKKKR